MGTIPPSPPRVWIVLSVAVNTNNGPVGCRDRMELRTPCHRQGQSDQRQGQPAVCRHRSRDEIENRSKG